MRKTVSILMFVALLACSCEKNIKFNGEYSGEKVVVQCFASLEDGVYARVTTSQFALKKYAVSPGELPVRNAKVVLSTSKGEVNMAWNEDAGLYLADYTPEAGESLGLNVYSNSVPEANRNVSSSTVVVTDPDLRVVEWEVVKDKNILSYWDCALRVRVELNDPAGKDYYYLSAYDSDYLDLMPYSSDIMFMKNDSAVDIVDGFTGGSAVSYELVSYFTDDMCDNGKYAFDIYLNWSSREGVEPQGNVFLNLTKMSADYYQYEQSVRAYDGDMLASIFGEAVAIHNNIKGGIGCFGSYSYIVRTLE